MTTLTSRIVRFTTAAALGLGLLWSAPSRGAPPNTIANSVAVCDPWNPQRCAQPDASGNLPITGSFSAAGFTPATTGTPISVTTSGVTGTLPAGAVVAAFNVGTTNTAYCKLGASATTSDIAIPPSSWFAFTVGAATQLTCITASSTTTVNMVGGTGLPTGAGGGGSGGGASSSFSAAFPSTGTAVGFTDGTNMVAGRVRNPGSGALVGDAAIVVADPNLKAAVEAPIPACATSPCTQVIGAVTGFQGTSALSATNGWYVNQLQGNAVLSASNPSFSRLTDGTNAQVTDPCQAVTKINLTGTQTTGTQIITGTAAKKTYICSFSIRAAAAEVWNVIAGTGSVCATGSSAVAGSTTAANGFSEAANGGQTLGNGTGTVMAATAANADNICITQNGSSRLTYQLTYVQL